VPMISHEASVPQRYGAALAATTVAYGASLLLRPLIDPNAFAAFCAAVMVSAWYGGLGPGLLATGLATGASAHLLTSSVRLLQSGVNDAVRLGLFMGAAVLISAGPIRDRDGCIIAGAVTFYDVTERERSELERGELLAREQAARVAAEAAERRGAFLADASSALAGSLDYQTTLASLAHLAVPFLADWCKIDMLEPDGGLRRIAIAYADPTNAE